MRIDELRARGRQVLKGLGIESFALDADLLIMHVMGFDKNELLINGGAPVPEGLVARFEEMLARRCKFEPMQYILGRCEFMSLEFLVNENVLIPRGDTEILVETVLANEANARGLEIGVGSGCVSISIAHYGEGIEMLGVDICPGALRVAALNGERLAGDGGPEFALSDLFEGIAPGRTFDFIVSNPPYIRTGEIAGLGAGVRDYEPVAALDGGVDGLDFYRRIAARAGGYLVRGGRIYFEIGCEQGEDVANLLSEHGFYSVRVVKDLAGLDRVVWGF